MLTFTLTPSQLAELRTLQAAYAAVYGDEETIWSLADLDELRELGGQLAVVVDQILSQTVHP